jgi:hypothetical protein
VANIDDIEIPSLLFDEQAASPGTPGTGLWRAFFKSDGLYIVDDAGVEAGPLGTSGGGAAPEVAVARVSTEETTTSADWVDLTTAGPAVTVDVPASGILQVSISCHMRNSSSNVQGATMGFALSGANTVAADDPYTIRRYPTNETARSDSRGATFVLTGLNSGSTTITAKYRRLEGGTGVFSNRELSAMVGLVAA